MKWVVFPGKGADELVKNTSSRGLAHLFPRPSLPVEDAAPRTAGTMMKSCWSPWYYYDNTEGGSKACAATTMFFSVFSIIYIIHCMTGGDSSQFFLPLFETDVDSSKAAQGWLFFVIFVYLLTYLSIRLFVSYA